MGRSVDRQSRQRMRECIMHIRIGQASTVCSVLFISRPRSEGWPHHGRTFSIYPCPLSFWLTLPRRVLSTSWCCPPRPCVAFLAYVHLALFLALSLSPGSSLVSSWCDHSMLASLLRRWPVPSENCRVQTPSRMLGASVKDCIAYLSLTSTRPWNLLSGVQLHVHRSTSPLTNISNCSPKYDAFLPSLTV